MFTSPHSNAYNFVFAILRPPVYVEETIWKCTGWMQKLKAVGYFSGSAADKTPAIVKCPWDLS